MKVEKKGQTSYSEVADELLKDVELAHAYDSHSRSRTPQVHTVFLYLCQPTISVI